MTEHFRLSVEDRIARVSLDRPERKNPLTFDSYAALRDWFRGLPYSDEIDVVVFGSNGGNFSSGGDVHDIIGPLVGRDMKGLLAFTRMTGDLVKAMLACTKPIIAAVDGICVGAGAGGPEHRFRHVAQHRREAGRVRKLHGEEKLMGRHKRRL